MVGGSLYWNDPHELVKTVLLAGSKVQGLPVRLEIERGCPRKEGPAEEASNLYTKSSQVHG